MSTLAAVSINIDGIEITTEREKTILECALEQGIYIPNLCHHPDLRPAGICGLCVVEIDRLPDLVTACNTVAQHGMVVHTNTAKVEKIRRLAAELMLSVHCADCSTCPKYGDCEFQSITQFLGVSSGRLRRRWKPSPTHINNSLFLYDAVRCVLCGRCVRGCRDLRGVQVLDFVKKDGETYIGNPGGLSPSEAGCRFCGACVELCPTGALRYQEGILPREVPRRQALVPCRAGCPAGIDVPRYLRLLRDSRASEALAVIREKVPFPATLGYVCNHACETFCSRKHLTGALSICRLKRYAAENDDKQWKLRSERRPETGKRVAVVGSGPAGLTAAYYLAKRGHGVTVFEEAPVAGGMLRIGIPEYRLPSEIVDQEIAEIRDAGVEIRTGVRVESMDALLGSGFDAVLLALGAHDGVRLKIPGADLEGVLVNMDFLRKVRLNVPINVGERVVVLGGGNVAFDCARVARRLGANEVHIACLESREKMPASPQEIEEGIEEGILIHPSRAFKEIIGDRGHVSGVVCQDVASFALDQEGRARLEVVEGSEHVLAADSVIFAVGQRPGGIDHFGLNGGVRGTLAVDPATLAASREGVFAAGDAVSGTSSVVEAIASGRKAAASLDRFLGGDGVIDEQLIPVEAPNPWLGRHEGFANLARYETVPAPADERVKSFTVVDPGFDAGTALKESERCLQCDLKLMITPKRFWNTLH